MMLSDLSAIASLSNVEKRLGDVRALDGVTLSLRPGEVTALLGSNGAGKSTAVGVLTGRFSPDAGESRLFGLDPRHFAARQRMGVMLQAANLPDVLTVRELIALQSGYYRDARTVDETLALAGLGGLATRRAGTLSGGQARLLQFALAICGRPEFIVLDEPTTGLDASARRALWTSVREASAGGAGVLLTTHYLEEADALADRIAVIARGRLVADGPPEAIRARAAATAIKVRTQLPPQAVEHLPHVRAVEREGAYWRILSADSPATLRALLSAAPDCTELRVEPASLEDALAAVLETDTLTRSDDAPQEWAA